MHPFPTLNWWRKVKAYPYTCLSPPINVSALILNPAFSSISLSVSSTFFFLPFVVAAEVYLQKKDETFLRDSAGLIKWNEEGLPSHQRK